MTSNSSPRIFTRKYTRKIIYYLLCSAFLGWMLSTISNRVLDVTFLNESAHSVVFIIWRIQLASATPSKLNEKARWYSPLASPSNQRLRGVWAMHTLPGKNGTTSARQ